MYLFPALTIHFPKYYTDDKANVKVQNGSLIITARAEKDENGKTMRYKLRFI